MSILAQPITINPATPESAPVSISVIHGARRLRGVAVYFPPGCYNAVGVRILDGSQMIAPVNGGWLVGDGNRYSWSENRALSDIGFLTVQGYSIADDWPHTPVVYLEVE